MTAAATDIVLKTRKRMEAALQIVNTQQIYMGGFSALCSPNHGTAAAQGRVKPWAALAEEIPTGFFIPAYSKNPGSAAGVLGDTTATPPLRGGMWIEGQILENITVTGASALTKNGSLVFATDDQTFTLTRPATLGIPVGCVIDYRTGSNVDVYFFSFGELLTIALGGSGQKTMCLGVASASIAASGHMLTGIVAPCHGKIVDFYGIVTTKLTDADVSLAITLTIGGVAVTGGSIAAWVTADALAAKKTSTAITAANIFHDGDLINVDAVLTNASTSSDPGLLSLYATIQTLPGV